MSAFSNKQILFFVYGSKIYIMSSMGKKSNKATKGKSETSNMKPKCKQGLWKQMCNQDWCWWAIVVYAIFMFLVTIYLSYIFISNLWIFAKDDFKEKIQVPNPTVEGRIEKCIHSKRMSQKEIMACSCPIHLEQVCNNPKYVHYMCTK